MQSLINASVVRTTAFWVLWVLGGLFSFYGLFGLVSPWILHPRFPVTSLQLLCHLAISLAAAIVGLAVVLRFRIAAIVLCVWFAYLEALQIWGTLHGFYLPHPPPYSAFDIVILVLLALLPVVLTILSWRALR